MDTGYVGGNVNAYLNGSGLFSGTGFVVKEQADALQVVPTGVYGGEDILIYDKIRLKIKRIEYSIEWAINARFDVTLVI